MTHPDVSPYDFDRQLSYLYWLADHAVAACRSTGRLLMPLLFSVESRTFWDWWDWPEDHAAALLAAWRAELDGISA